MSVGHTIATRFVAEVWSPKRLAQEIDRVMLVDLADRQMPPVRDAYKPRTISEPKHVLDDA
jgi:hypothetical protein